MNISNKNINKKKQTQPQGQSSAAPAAIKAKTIKLRVDVHLDLFVFTRITDGSTPQPAQRFKPAQFLLWCAKQLRQAEQVFTCYEAGPFGYTLHRKLERMGLTNYVVRPRDWDEYGRKVKTDQRDATALADCLDRHDYIRIDSKDPGSGSGRSGRAARRPGQTDQPDPRAGSGRLGALPQTPRGGQLHRPVSERGPLQRPSLPGFD